MTKKNKSLESVLDELEYEEEKPTVQPPEGGRVSEATKRKTISTRVPKESYQRLLEHIQRAGRPRYSRFREWSPWMKAVSFGLVALAAGWLMYETLTYQPVRSRISKLRDRVVQIAGQGRIYVKTHPEDARVRILNIKPEYEQGIEVKPGRYLLEVSRLGYKTTTQWIDIKAGTNKPFHFSLDTRVDPTSSEEDCWRYGKKDKKRQGEAQRLHKEALDNFSRSYHSQSLTKDIGAVTNIILSALEAKKYYSDNGECGSSRIVGDLMRKLKLAIGDWNPDARQGLIERVNNEMFRRYVNNVGRQKYDSAAADDLYTRAILTMVDIFPEKSIGWAAVGYECNDLRVLRVAYKKVAELDPKNWRHHHNFGTHFLTRNCLDEAEDAFRAGLSAAGNGFEKSISYCDVSRIHAERNEFDSAIAILKKSLEFQPTNRESFLMMGQVYEKKGQPQEAKQWYQRVIDDHRRDEIYKSAQRALANTK